MNAITPLDGPTPGAPTRAPGVASAGAADFAAALDRATGATAPLGRITLGQMLRLYQAPVATMAPPVRGGRGAAVAAAAVPATVPAHGDPLGVGPTVRPLALAVGSTYGPRRHPIHGDVRMHHGVDIAAPTGTPIHAFAAGTVTFAGPRGGYGNVVVVEHADGVESRYAHQAAIDVVVGQHVAAGEVVGRVGATGTATGPHLHFELRRDGQSIDPGPHLP